MIRIHNLSKSYQCAGEKLSVLTHINLHVRPGELVALMGQSGAGKSTLLNIIGILDHYDAGTYLLNKMPIHHTLTEDEASQHRAKLIGFIFQRFHLIPFKTAVDNVALPLYYQKVPKKIRTEKAMAMLERVGLSDKASMLPHQLSGGQQQRVAIARALVTNPPLILADEPTGALDSTTSQEIMTLLQSIHQAGNTLLIVTHDQAIAKQCHRTIVIKDGKI